MKKALVALFATLGLVLGSVALTSPAQAKVYPNTVKTKTTAKAPSSVKTGKKFTVTFTVAGGNSKANGTAVVKFNGKSYKVTIKNGKGKLSLKAPKLSKKAKSKSFKVSVSFTPKKGTVHKKSSSSKTVKVKKK